MQMPGRDWKSQANNTRIPKNDQHFCIRMRNKSEICLEYMLVQILINSSVHISIWYSPRILTLKFNWLGLIK